jgi:CDP-glucose 4,6-dehydratase
MKVDRSFWNHKKVLITGHSGFKGMWLSIILKELGANIYGISKEHLNSDLYKFSNSEKIFNEENFIDIGSVESDDLKDLLHNKKFDIVFHLAAQSLVTEAYKDPLNTLKVNIFGTFQILRACIDFNLTDSVIVSTTDKVYKDTSSHNSELSALGGNEFYSASKVSQEMLIEAFKNYKNEIKISTVRSGNVLGPGDGANGRIVTDIIDALKAGNDIKLRQPYSIRPWQYILDSLYGYLLVAQNNKQNSKSSIYNLNSAINSEFTVKEITEKFISVWGSSIKAIELDNKKFYETEKLRLDSSKAVNELGWNSSVHIDSIIEDIYKWEIAGTNELKEKLVINQVKEYFSL